MFAERVNIQRKPEIRYFFPDWWHSHGDKMILDEKQSNSDQVVINNGSVAKLIIAKTNDPHDLPWNIQWAIVHFYGEISGGNRKMRSESLFAAFGFDDSSTIGSKWLIQRYGGSCAEQGNFIRWNDFLNIPHPGTGHDGDPNISIRLNPEIKQAVLNLLPEHYALSLNHGINLSLPQPTGDPSTSLRVNANLP